MLSTDIMDLNIDESQGSREMGGVFITFMADF